MGNSMSNITIHELGSLGDRTSLWGIYDDLRKSQNNIIPGILIQIRKTDDGLDGSLDYILNNKATIQFIETCQKLNTGVSVYWSADPEILKVPRRFDTWNLDRSESLQETKDKLIFIKDCIERYCEQTYGYIPEAYKEIEKIELKRNNVIRVWQLEQKALSELINVLLSEMQKAFNDSQPSSFHQTNKILQRLIEAWGENLLDIDDDALPLLVICLKMNINKYDSNVLGSAILHSKRLSAISNDYTSRFVLNEGIDEIYAGIASFIDISSVSNGSAELELDAEKLLNWLDTQDDEYRLDCILTKNNIIVINIQEVDIPVVTKMKLAIDGYLSNREFALNKILSIGSSEISSLLVSELSLEQAKLLRFVGNGVPASPGVCSGMLCLDAKKIEEFKRQGVPTIFVSHSPGPEVIKYALNADGLLFATGGTTSHIAVIARGINKPCVLGANSIVIEKDLSRLVIGDYAINSGEWITIDGSKGQIYSGRTEIIQTLGPQRKELNSLLDICDRQAKIITFANADTAKEVEDSFSLGAKGVGLCRIEHLLSRPESIENLQIVILLSWLLSPVYEKILIAKSDFSKWSTSNGAITSLAEFKEELHKHNVFQRYTKELEILGNNLKKEFASIFNVSNGRPITIRLIDPPLAEFLNEAIINKLHVEGVLLNDQKEQLTEYSARKDSMLGLRGVRLCNIAPEFTRTQLEAIFSAAQQESRNQPIEIDILIPFVVDALELDAVRELIIETLQDLNLRCKWRLGAMIETPRSAIIAKELARKVDFLSIGTNDLTQLTWAASRDYAESDFLNHAVYAHLEQDPFLLLDQAGVGKLIEYAIKDARSVSPNISIGICGEHAGEPRNIEYFSKLDINYVSCSSSRISVTRLVCGQEGIKSNLKH